MRRPGIAPTRPMGCWSRPCARPDMSATALGTSLTCAGGPSVRRAARDRRAPDTGRAVGHVRHATRLLEPEARMGAHDAGRLRRGMALPECRLAGCPSRFDHHGHPHRARRRVGLRIQRGGRSERTSRSLLRHRRRDRDVDTRRKGAGGPRPLERRRRRTAAARTRRQRCHRTDRWRGALRRHRGCGARSARGGPPRRVDPGRRRREGRLVVGEPLTAHRGIGTRRRGTR